MARYVHPVPVARLHAFTKSLIITTLVALHPRQVSNPPCISPQVFSFGVTLYEILERKRPFAGMDGFQIQTQAGPLQCLVHSCFFYFLGGGGTTGAFVHHKWLWCL